MKTLIDDSFYCEKQRWGTWNSYDKDDNPLVTSLTEDTCIAATRSILKWCQEGFPESHTHEGTVGGKL